MRTLLARETPDELRRELRDGSSGSLKWRRAIIGASITGMAAMGAVSLLQTGVIRHLPDPPLRGFNSDKVNLSSTAYALGVPDGTLSFASLAANIPLAAWGGENRAKKMPWLPIAIAGKALIEAVVAGWYFYQMPTKQNAWCAYCITGAAANVAIAGLSLPEARTAIRALRRSE